MGFAAAAPAATTAFGSTAFWAGTAAAAPVVSSSFVPTLLTASKGISSGGLLSGFTLTNLIPTMEKLSPYLFWGSQLIGAGARIGEGNYQSKMYDLRSLELQADMTTKRMNAEIESLERLKNLKRVMATNLAKNYSGGVSGLDGSAKLYEQVAQQEYGKDYQVALLNMENALLKGQVQSDIYDLTSQQVVNNAYLDSAVQLGTAAYNYSKIGGTP